MFHSVSRSHSLYQVQFTSLHIFFTLFLPFSLSLSLFLFLTLEIFALWIIIKHRIIHSIWELALFFVWRFLSFIFCFFGAYFLLLLSFKWVFCTLVGIRPTTNVITEKRGARSQCFPSHGYDPEKKNTNTHTCTPYYSSIWASRMMRCVICDINNL